MVIPIKLDTMVCAPQYSQDEFMLANWGDIKDYLLHMSVCYCERDMDLLCDGEEVVTGNCLELKHSGAWFGGDPESLDYSRVDEVSHCSRVNECF